jgi:hypothetical protein
MDLYGPGLGLGLAESGYFASHGRNLPPKAVEVSQRGEFVTNSNTVAL